MDADALVRDYLIGLDAAAVRLPSPRRSELREEVQEHIEAALTEAGKRDVTTVRNVLERLGAADEIVAAEAAGAQEGTGVPPTSGSVAGTTGGRLGAVEIIALLLLTVGSILLPFIGPVMGLVFVWLSDRWHNREKLIATAIVVVLLVLPFALFLGASTSAGMNAPQLVAPETVGP